MEIEVVIVVDTRYEWLPWKEEGKHSKSIRHHSLSSATEGKCTTVPTERHCEANWLKRPFTSASDMLAIHSLYIQQQKCFLWRSYTETNSQTACEKAIGWIGIIFVCFMCLCVLTSTTGTATRLSFPYIECRLLFSPQAGWQRTREKSDHHRHQHHKLSVSIYY